MIDTTLVPQNHPIKKRRFSSESVNDLLFWGVHLCVVAISLAIIWSRLNVTARALERLIKTQNEELALARKQTEAAEKIAQAQLVDAIESRQAERTRSLQFSAASKTLNDVLDQAIKIQVNVTDTLAKTTQTNELILAASQQTKAAAFQAAATASHTGSVVATKVVTTSARDQLNAQKQALARKQAQLARTIKSVKKNGPTIFQRLFNQ